MDVRGAVDVILPLSRRPYRSMICVAVRRFRRAAGTYLEIRQRGVCVRWLKQRAELPAEPYGVCTYLSPVMVIFPHPRLTFLVKQKRANCTNHKSNKMEASRGGWLLSSASIALTACRFNPPFHLALKSLHLPCASKARATKVMQIIATSVAYLTVLRTVLDFRLCLLSFLYEYGVPESVWTSPYGNVVIRVATGNKVK